ncbi:hypothetical protein COMA2_60087 [Candidatus Nitrospira nitrificans]|uniref:Uncharacterized protein n=1 Tax=Candidatus Nitrospira nitrificans TaxID=1742973 RepID=A0A0S4LQV3_9BACT|nr:hypothetical protein COMA2_60087 [Candidatus Nitrospira nitrificans]
MASNTGCGKRRVIYKMGRSIVPPIVGEIGVHGQRFWFLKEWTDWQAPRKIHPACACDPL